MKREVSVLIILYWSTVIQRSNQHGRLINPPARSSAWRYGYDTPVDYDDNQLYCGGLQVQWNNNGGKCGICGDPFDGVREHEYPGGKFTKPLRITGNYASGSILDATIELTTTHLGHFMFRLCPDTSDVKEVTQECLDQYVLPILNKTDEADRFYIGMEQSSSVYTLPLRLPQDLTCTRCVLQWTYTTGNTWGSCATGVSATGCGPQETFRGCADIFIYPRSSVSLSVKQNQNKVHHHHVRSAA